MTGGKHLADMTLDELWHLFPIILAPYNPAYRGWFDAEKLAIEAALGDAVERVRHIGSTSVPGLLAKPTVDILLEVAGNAAPGDLKSRLAALSYTVMAETTDPDLRIDLCKGYTEQGFAERVFHLHLRRRGDWDEPYFCAYLRRHPETAAQYADLKRELFPRFEFDRDGYTAAKGEFIRRVTGLARKENLG
ncbi:MAG: GrpB family protein [Victivallaceae bacterium]|nr:GrpB family protein [Victivallaceae bacterium]